VVEHLVAPNIAEKFNKLGYHFTGESPAGYIERGYPAYQVDILLTNSEYIMAVEVKSDVKLDDITEHAERLSKMRVHYSIVGDRRFIRGAIAGAIFHDHLKDIARKAGLYVIVQSGDTVKIDVPDGFQPKDW